MPVINITSMQGLIDALSSVGSYTTLEIMNDLDFNDVVATFTSTVRIPTDGSSSNHTTDITINGNNHAIYNLDNSAVKGSIFGFYYCSNVVIKDLSFLNCHMTKSTSRIFTSMNGYGVKVINAVIQGRFNTAPFTYTDIEDSMITYNYGTTNLSESTLEYIRCWIKFDRCTSSSVSEGYICNCKSCYLTGNIGYSNVSTSTPLINGMSNSCVNIRIGIVNSVQLKTTNIFKAVGDYVNIINIEKITLTTPSELVDSTKCKLITDEQMKNAEYLADIGFDIIP